MSTTVFPRNLAAARFYFKAPFGATTIQGRRLQRSTCTRVHSFNNKPICMHVKCAYTYVNPLPCGKISRAAGFWGVARFRGNTVFSPQRVHVMQPNASTIDQELRTIPFLNSQLLDGLNSELPAYLARAADTDQQFDILEWWMRNAPDLPNWSGAAKKKFLIQPSSAASEKVFSLLKTLLVHNRTTPFEITSRHHSCYSSTSFDSPF